MSKVSLEKDKIRILLLEGVHQSALETFKNNGYTNIEYLKTSLPEEELVEKVKDAHFIGLRSRTQITEKVVDAAQKLVAIGCFCIGTNQVNLEATQRRGIPVFNAPFSNTRSVAELVLGQLILLLRQVPSKSAKAHRGEWEKTANGSYEARGKTLGIIGFGRIGTELAKRGASFGMTVIAYDPFVKNSEYAEMKAEMKDVFNISDYVSLHLPLIESTMGVINSETLKEFKDGSFLINTGRGKTIVEEDVVDALMSGKLAGFGNDVWYSDPPEKNLFADLPNVLLMPHLGASTKENLLRISVIIENIINEYVNN